MPILRRSALFFALGALSGAGAFGATRYDTASSTLQQLVKQHPNYAQVFTFGNNDDGAPLTALRVSTTPDLVDFRKPAFLIVSTHHGNEGKSTDFTLAFAKRLLDRFEKHRFDSQFSEAEWTIIPVLNVSGYNDDDRYEHGIDPNRDYPGVCGNDPHDQLASTRNLQQLLANRRFAASLTVHGYVGSLTYPWGIDATNTRTLDQNRFDQLASKAAAINHYRHGTSTDIVYPANNTFEDFVYYKYGTWSLLLELRDGSAADIQSTAVAIEGYFDQVDSTPSVKNQMLGQCNRSVPDLRLE